MYKLQLSTHGKSRAPIHYVLVVQVQLRTYHQKSTATTHRVPVSQVQLSTSHDKSRTKTHRVPVAQVQLSTSHPISRATTHCMSTRRTSTTSTSHHKSRASIIEYPWHKYTAEYFPPQKQNYYI